MDGGARSASHGRQVRALRLSVLRGTFTEQERRDHEFRLSDSTTQFSHESALDAQIQRCRELPWVR